MDQKVNQQKNTVCLEQQIYASPENLTPTLLVVFEALRKSDLAPPCQKKAEIGKPHLPSLSEKIRNRLTPPPSWWLT